MAGELCGEKGGMRGGDKRLLWTQDEWEEGVLMRIHLGYNMKGNEFLEIQDS
jgi:hypothetical protein